MCYFLREKLTGSFADQPQCGMDRHRVNMRVTARWELLSSGGSICITTGKAGCRIGFFEIDVSMDIVSKRFS